MSLADKLKELVQEHAKYDPSLTKAGNPALPTTPLYDQDVEERANRQRKTAAQIRSEDQQILADSQFPSTDCFKPGELLLATSKNEALRESRWVHLRSCMYCQALVANTKVDEQAVAEISRLLAKDSTPRQVGWWERLLTLPPTPRFVLAMEIVLPVVLVGVAVGSVFLAHRLAIVPPTTVSLDPPSFSDARALLLGAFAVAPFLLLAVFALWIGRHFLFDGFRRSGAVYAGILLGVLAGGYAWWNVEQRARQTQITMMLLSSRVAEVAAASLSVHKNTGEFPNLDFSPGALVVKTTMHTTQQAEYNAHAAGLKGSVVADVRPDGGTVYWRGERESHELARLVLGKIRSVNADSVDVSWTNGTTGRVKASWDPFRKPGDTVITVVDARTNVATDVYPIATAEIRR